MDSFLSCPLSESLNSCSAIESSGSPCSTCHQWWCNSKIQFRVYFLRQLTEPTFLRFTEKQTTLRQNCMKVVYWKTVSGTNSVIEQSELGWIEGELELKHNNSVSANWFHRAHGAGLFVICGSVITTFGKRLLNGMSFSRQYFPTSGIKWWQNQTWKMACVTQPLGDSSI